MIQPALWRGLRPIYSIFPFLRRGRGCLISTIKRFAALQYIVSMEVQGGFKGSYLLGHGVLRQANDLKLASSPVLRGSCAMDTPGRFEAHSR